MAELDKYYTRYRSAQTAERADAYPRDVGVEAIDFPRYAWWFPRDILVYF